jgi:hypothetical protein
MSLIKRLLPLGPKPKIDKNLFLLDSVIEASFYSQHRPLALGLAKKILPQKPLPIQEQG